MKNLMQITFVLLLATVMGGGCKKEKNPVVKTPEELLVGKWRLAVIYDHLGADVTTACDRNTQIQFFADKKMSWTESTVQNGNCQAYVYDDFGNTTYRINQAGKLSFHWVSTDGKSTHNFSEQTFEVNGTTLTVKLFDGHKGVVYKRIN